MVTCQEIAKEHRRQIERSCRLLARCGELVADEIEQEIALVLFVEFGDDVDAVEAHGLAKKTIDQCIQREYRQQGKTHVPESCDIADLYVELGSDDPAYESIEDKIVVEDMLEMMPGDVRQAMRLRYEHGLKIDEIAAILGCANSTVASRLRAGAHEVKDFMQDKVLAGVLLPRYRR